jgi:hypothetical protein
VAVEGDGKFPPPGSLWDVCYELEFACMYANGVRLICKTESPYARFEGEAGWIQANFSGSNRLVAEAKSLLDSQIGPDELHFPLLHEKRDFLNAVKTRRQTLADAEVGHRAASVGSSGTHRHPVGPQAGVRRVGGGSADGGLGDHSCGETIAGLSPEEVLRRFTPEGLADG